MANNFEKASNNFGNNFSNNNGNYRYTTNGHDYDDSAYVLAKFNGQVDPISISSTKNGYPANSVTTYGQGYDVSVKSHSHVDDYTQAIELGWPTNINTKGKIEGTLTFSIDKTTVPASGGTVDIQFPNLKYTATRDTRGYRYVDVTLKPNVPSNSDTLDDDGTVSDNAIIESTTYVGENRQGFLNYEEPMLDYVIYSSYGEKGGNPFNLLAESTIYNGPDSITYAVEKIEDISSTIKIMNTYMHMYDNLNTIFSYAYAPYHDEVKMQSGKEGVGWTHINTRLEVTSNLLSTYPKKLTLSYGSITSKYYYNISYDGLYNATAMSFIAAFDYNGSYGGVTSSTATDTNLTSYDRSTVLSDFFPGISNSLITPSYLHTSYTITQPKATINVSYLWSLPEEGDCTNYDSITGDKYVGFGSNESIPNRYDQPSIFLYVNKQNHYKGYVTGNLDFSLAREATGRIINIDADTTLEGTLGNLKWTNRQNRTQRYFNVRLVTEYSNCKNQNITSISDEYYNNDKTKPMVTLKCRQLAANWPHPGLQMKIKGERYNIPNDSKYDNINPTIYITTANYYPSSITFAPIQKKYSFGGNESNFLYWTIAGHKDSPNVSSLAKDNTYLGFQLSMPDVPSNNYVKSTVSGSISASANATYVESTASSITITPTWNLQYTMGYNEGYEAAEWKYSLTYIAGFSDEQGSNDGTGMDCSGVTGFDDFIVHLNACENSSYKYPKVTLTATSSNSLFTLDTTTNTANSKHSLAVGAQSKGFIVSVPANLKQGSEWYAAITTTPTDTVEGYITLGSGDLMNSASRSTTINFTNSFDTSLTKGNITSPSNITITQRQDKWGSDALGDGLIGLCFETTGNAFVDNQGLCIVQPIPTVGSISTDTNNRYKIGKLYSNHQLVVTGIGTITGTSKTCSYNNIFVSVLSTGSPAVESESKFTYTSSVIAWCKDYKNVGVSYGPNGSTSNVLANYTVNPKAVSWKRQYKLLTDRNKTDITIGWQNSSSLRINKNVGTTTEASCTTNRNTNDKGPFSFVPKKYNGSSSRTFNYQVGVYDNNSGQRFIREFDYNIIQSGTSSYYITSYFTFSSNAVRCTINGLQKKVESDTPQTCGSFTVTPDTDPFYGYTTYTIGMVPNSLDTSNYNETITKNGTITSTHTGYIDFLKGTTINFYFGLSGSNSDYITCKKSGYIKYKFYYKYNVFCSSNSGIQSADIVSDTVTSTPPSNTINYYKRRLVNGSWSSSLTQLITSIGTYSVTGGWVAINGLEYSTSKRSTFSITVRTYEVVTEYQYQIPLGTKMSIAFYEGDGNVASNPKVLDADVSMKYYVVAKGPDVYIQERHRTYRLYNTGKKGTYTTWTSFANTTTKAYTINPSTYTFVDPDPGQTLSKVFNLSIISQYNGQAVNTNNVVGTTATFSVKK